MFPPTSAEPLPPGQPRAPWMIGTAHAIDAEGPSPFLDLGQIAPGAAQFAVDAGCYRCVKDAVMQYLHSFLCSAVTNQPTPNRPTPHHQSPRRRPSGSRVGLPTGQVGRQRVPPPQGDHRWARTAAGMLPMRLYAACFDCRLDRQLAPHPHSHVSQPDLYALSTDVIWS